MVVGGGARQPDTICGLAENPVVSLGAGDTRISATEVEAIV